LFQLRTPILRTPKAKGKEMIQNMINQNSVNAIVERAEQFTRDNLHELAKELQTLTKGGLVDETGKLSQLLAKLLLMGGSQSKAMQLSIAMISNECIKYVVDSACFANSALSEAMNDLRLTGSAFMRDGKRIDPADVCLPSARRVSLADLPKINEADYTAGDGVAGLPEKWRLIAGTSIPTGVIAAWTICVLYTHTAAQSAGEAADDLTDGQDEARRHERTDER